ncbi:MAG: helicase-related protein [Pelagibacteraceae bacterium]|jgi:ATP-dependent RNA helicase SUPV3L1/SUV3|nr:helicase [Candidatus Pelagibacter sp.]MDP6680880.1 helicase-related protein [Pelagibacteraceae bacterium]MDP6710841.1 helicase-related protein [Pelagibacteraceae bacterium]
METNIKKITAILGPTNTGKTHLAVETMLSYESGILGFPLRLLAREIFDKCVDKIGQEKVALITGEEKIIPKSPKYYICTVESMPQNIMVDFVAVDEIQMCTDHERGHIFTERLLNARGDKLTMFLGSSTIKHVITPLIDNVEFVDRERYSKLTYSGYKKISRLNPKTALIAFSVDEVYAIAELVRRQKGGAAIIMGSLSPKTRNSQVKLYQSGDTNFLVATDAIGMGINMDIDNVSFTNLKKFDGKKTRQLNISEISQIAGRAGRHINDGSFGITGQCQNFSSDIVEKLEKHELGKINIIYWRNFELNFENLDNLLFSLEKKPNNEFLRRINDCEDEKVLKFIIKNNNDIKIINTKEVVQILWECCQIPNFSKKAYGNHIDIVKKVFSFLTSKVGKVSNDYIKTQLKYVDRYDGNIDTLTNRISNVRTWAYIANKKGWIDNSDFWIERTKSIEDKLSDKLHEELTKNFVDKRISVLSRSLKQDIILGTEINNENKVIIDGQYIGRLRGLELDLDLKTGSLKTDIKSLRKAARQAIAPELMRRTNKIASEENLELGDDYKIYWMDNPIAHITPGKNYLNPKLELLVDEAIDLESKEKLKKNLEKKLDKLITNELSDLVNLSKLNFKNNYVRALCYQLYENNGVIKREIIDPIIKNIPKEDRVILRKIGIKLGRYNIFLPKMLKPSAVNLRIKLWKLYFPHDEKNIIPKFGLNFLTNEKKNRKFMLICGFENFDKFYVRVDILERLFLKIIENTKAGTFKIDSDMINLVGCNKENFFKLLKLMKYKHKKVEKSEEEYFVYRPKHKKNIQKNAIKKLNKNKLFDKLSELRFR